MKYKLTIFPAIEAGNSSTIFLFETKEELEAAHTSCAGLLIFMQDQAKVMKDYSNCFICEKKSGNNWIEIDS